MHTRSSAVATVSQWGSLCPALSPDLGLGHTALRQSPAVSRRQRRQRAAIGQDDRPARPPDDVHVRRKKTHQRVEQGRETVSGANAWCENCKRRNGPKARFGLLSYRWFCAAIRCGENHGISS